MAAQDRPRRERLNPSGVHAPAANYSHVARVGGTLYISGQVPADTSGNLVGAGDAEAQAEQCFRNLESILKHFGGGLEHVMKTTTYLTDRGYRAPVAAARDRVFSAPYPAYTLVVIAGLASPDYLVEVEAIAVLDA